MNTPFLAASTVAFVFLTNGALAFQSPASAHLPYIAAHDPQFIRNAVTARAGGRSVAEKNKMIRQGLSGEAAAPKDVTYHDDRLKPKTMVLGVDVEGASKAFPLEALRQVRVVNDAIGGKPVLVVHQPSSDTTTAFLARAHGRTLTFDWANAGATSLVDRETGSHWNAYGTCVSGRLKGYALEPLVLEPEYWFAWSEFHRETQIYTPQP